MIFRILDLLSNSHAAVVNGRAFGFEPIQLVITSEHFIDNCLHASCSILCGIHSADETQSGRNSCPEFAFSTFSLDFQFGLAVPLSFFFFSCLRSVSLAVYCLCIK